MRKKITISLLMILMLLASVTGIVAPIYGDSDASEPVNIASDKSKPVYIRFNKATGIFEITGDENNEMSSDEFRQYMAQATKSSYIARTKTVKYSSNPVCDGIPVKGIDIKDPIAFPYDSVALFSYFPKEVKLNKNIHTENVVYADNMFSYSASDPDVSNWNTGNMVSISDMFNGNKVANPDVSNWNTSKVTKMVRVFSDTTANPDVSKWDTGNVIDMSGMFNNNKIAEPNVSNWNTSKVINMSGIFTSTNADPDVSNWNTSSVTNFANMFYNNTKCNPDVSNWDTSKGIVFTAVFYGTKSAKPDVSKWNTVNMSSANKMFSSSNAEPDVSNWNTAKLKDANNMFANTTFADPDVSKWNTERLENTGEMFRDAKNANPDVSKWNTKNLIIMDYMFCDSKKATPDVSKWNTERARTANYMFYRSIADPDVSNWNTANLKEANGMFLQAKNANPDVSKWNTMSLVTAKSMFSRASSVESVDLSQWNTDKLTITGGFLTDTQVKYADISTIVNNKPTQVYSFAGNSNTDDEYAVVMRGDTFLYNQDSTMFNNTCVYKITDKELYKTSGHKEGKQYIGKFKKTYNYKENPLNIPYDGTEYELSNKDNREINVTIPESIKVKPIMNSVETKPAEYTIKNNSKDTKVTVKQINTTPVGKFKMTDYTDSFEQMPVNSYKFGISYPNEERELDVLSELKFTVNVKISPFTHSVLGEQIAKMTPVIELAE